MRCPVCHALIKEGVATLDAPYHLAFSGIPNLWLIGTPRYWCASCKTDRLWFLGNERLICLIAKVICGRAPALSRAEVAYLRLHNRATARLGRPPVAVDWKAIRRTRRVAQADVPPIVLQCRPKLRVDRRFRQVDATGFERRERVRLLSDRRGTGDS